MYHDLDDAPLYDDDFAAEPHALEADPEAWQAAQAIRSIAPRVHGGIVSGAL